MAIGLYKKTSRDVRLVVHKFETFTDYTDTTTYLLEPTCKSNVPQNNYTLSMNASKLRRLFSRALFHRNYASVW